MLSFETKNLEKPLSEEELKCLLKRYDTTGDGKLNRQELKVAFKDLGLWFCGLRAYQAMQHADKNNDDLGLWFCGLRAYQAMQHADKNNDGLIFDDEMDVLVEFALKWGFTLA
ncbi:hypothetical protein HAX54_031243 [Datura stramonium]|uniref:EF-hand domain-containing protein n=1 Tax=Datura stramonium TaxID=4076 RepID=A0ABS8VAA5_DATST|nr:hypothetical protein [Datura stramonium]